MKSARSYSLIATLLPSRVGLAENASYAFTAEALLTNRMMALQCDCHTDHWNLMEYLSQAESILDLLTGEILSLFPRYSQSLK